jgi:hypothetical protein
MKAASTLQKRASSLDKLLKCLRAEGQLYPLRLSEAQLYSALCRMRATGSGATSAQHVIEALHFMDATAKFLCIDLTDVISARCRGVARDMYLMKDPLQQKRPLTVEQVKWLEHLMESSGPVHQCIIGQLLFCIHACCRWKDSQRLKSITTESGHGELLLFADALSSKSFDGRGENAVLAVCCHRHWRIGEWMGNLLARGKERTRVDLLRFCFA